MGQAGGGGGGCAAQLCSARPMDRPRDSGTFSVRGGLLICTWTLKWLSSLVPHSRFAAPVCCCRRARLRLLDALRPSGSRSGLPLPCFLLTPPLLAVTLSSSALWRSPLCQRGHGAVFRRGWPAGRRRPAAARRGTPVCAATGATGAGGHLVRGVRAAVLLQWHHVLCLSRTSCWWQGLGGRRGGRGGGRVRATAWGAPGGSHSSVQLGWVCAGGRDVRIPAATAAW